MHNHPSDDSADNHDEVPGGVPAASTLSTEEYLTMARTAATRPHYEILRRLVYSEGKRASQLGEELIDELDIDENTLTDHLAELVGVGLVTKRGRTEPDKNEPDVYYEATIFGEKALHGGIEDLMAAEYEFDELYNSTA